jgi:outer membrane protein assembly factor BamB
VWGDRVFLTTSINTTTEAPDLTSKAVELEGNRDMGRHQWKLYSLERRTGRVLWEKVVYEGVPRVKRHGKASHASASPATNGSVVVVSMGSEGLYCFDMEGTLKWKKDLGVLDVGWVDEPDNQWGPGSSPIIDGDLVIFQDDRQRSRSTSHLIRIYFTSEDGVVYVVRAGRAFELMASNDMREVCMATPAIANDMMIVRTRTRLYGLVAAR